MDECKHELWTFPTLPVGICCECRKTEREIELEAKVERLEKAIRDHKDSFTDSEFYTEEDEKLWAALEGDKQDGT